METFYCCALLLLFVIETQTELNLNPKLRGMSLAIMNPIKTLQRFKLIVYCDLIIFIK